MRRSADFASEFFGETSGVSLVHPHNTVVVITLDTPHNTSSKAPGFPGSTRGLYVIHTYRSSKFSYLRYKIHIGPFSKSHVPPKVTFDPFDGARAP